MKKFLHLVSATFFILALCIGCGAGNNYQHISQIEAEKIISAEKNLIILDVRTQEEYEKRHIPNSILLPIDEIKKGNFEEKLPDKSQKILIYCWTGRRAEDSAEILVKKGYRNVFEFGGLVNWTGEVEGSEVESKN